jgi:predicted ATPase
MHFFNLGFFIDRQSETILHKIIQNKKYIVSENPDRYIDRALTTMKFEQLPDYIQDYILHS